VVVSKLGLALGALCLVAACTTDDSTLLGVEVPTAVGVDPVDFLGSTPCGSGDGSMRAYVATVIDVTSPTAPFTVGSTLPLPCGFPGEVRQEVVVGNFYRVEVDGYDLVSSDLAPVDYHARDMVDAQGDVVLPRWKATCGPEKGVAAALDVRVLASPCTPLLDSGSPGPASVELHADATLGSLACTAAGGTVESFDVAASSGLPGGVDVACDAPPLVWDAVPLEPLDFEVTAHAGAETLAAGCAAAPRAGRRVTATCSLLASAGSLVIAPAAPCGAAASSYRARIGSLFASGEVACADQTVFTPLAPASYVVTLELFDAAGMLVETQTCAAEVQAGQAVVASCF